MQKKNLLLDRRYWPSFWTQFCGAFNDNIFKNALVILITYRSFQLGAIKPEMMVALCGGIFILPFFLFSATAGQVCDKYTKNKLMFYIKVWEIAVMLIGAYGFISENVIVLLVTLFLMGLQSTFFGPLKYSILPELLETEELVKGNAYFSMGTFVSILLGTILGGVLIGIESIGGYLVSSAVIIMAIIGTLFSKGVQDLPATNPELKINIGIIKPTWEILKIANAKKSVFLAIMGISWFWFLGAALLSMFPVYVKDIIGGDEQVVTLFLALFSIGVATGSIICERLSRDGLELGLVPLGTFGISLFLLDLFLLDVKAKPETIIGVGEFLSSGVSFRILLDLFFLSIFSGFYTVPLYTFIQQYSADSIRSRVIAGLNIYNSLFMVVSAVLLILFYQMGLNVPQIYGILALVNLVVAFVIYFKIPEFLLRFIAAVLIKFIYRVKVHGQENIPREGGCILVCNHVSFIDWLVIYGNIKRPVRFVMYHKFLKLPLVGFLFRDAKVIAIAPKKEDPKRLEDALNSIEQGLNQGDIICLFPEGAITKDGDLAEFRPGIERMLEKSPVPVIPMSLHGLWGSFFSKMYGKGLSKPKVALKNWLMPISIKIYEKWDPEQVSAAKLEEYLRSKVD